MNDSISFLIVDDERQVVNTLQTIISEAFPGAAIHTALDGIEGWEMINKMRPHILITDIDMPGLSGFQLCEKIRSNEDLSKIYIIILTPKTSHEQKVKSLEHGADDYINKPLSQDELKVRLSSAARIVNMQMKLHWENLLLVKLTNELKETIKDLTKLSIKFLQARIPASIDMLKRVADASVWIAKELKDFNEEQLRDIEIAASLCYAGKIFLPDNLVKNPVMLNGRPSSYLMFQVPVSAKGIVSSVKKFEEAGEILYHIYENFDGSGIPDRLKSWQIPLGARIIRVVLDYEESIFLTKQTSEQVLEILNREAKRLYDHRVVTLFKQYIALTGTETSKERATKLHELEEGMILSRDIIANSGMKIVGSGTVLRQDIIKKIIAHNSSDPILGNIFVKI